MAKNNEGSSRTIRRRLEGENLSARIARRVHFLRPYHLRSRLEFGKSHISETEKYSMGWKKDCKAWWAATSWCIEGFLGMALVRYISVILLKLWGRRKGTLLAILPDRIAHCNRLQMVLEDLSLFFFLPAICLKDMKRSLFTSARVLFSVVFDVFCWIFLDHHHFFVI